MWFEAILVCYNQNYVSHSIFSYEMPVNFIVLEYLEYRLWCHTGEKRFVLSMRQM